MNPSLCFEFRGVAKIGVLVNFEAGMDIMDLLYEKEETTMLYANPRFLAASVLACSITLNFNLFKCCVIYVLNFVGTKYS